MDRFISNECEKKQKVTMYTGIVFLVPPCIYASSHMHASRMCSPVRQASLFVRAFHDFQNKSRGTHDLTEKGIFLM